MRYFSRKPAFIDEFELDIIISYMIVHADINGRWQNGGNRLFVEMMRQIDGRERHSSSHSWFLSTCEAKA
jgi:hypothetical protein